MSDFKPHLIPLEETERKCIPGFVEVLRTEGIEGIRYALWDMTRWHEHYDPLRVARQGHRGTETDRLGDVGQDGEDYLYRHLRSSRTADRGDDEHFV